MKKRMSVLVLLCLLLGTSAFAARTAWFGGWSSDNFMDAGNWTGPLTPVDTAISNAGVAGTIYGTNDVEYNIFALKLGEGDTNTNVLNVHGGIYNATNQMCIGSLWLTGDGELNVYDGEIKGNAVYVGHSGDGVVNVQGGSLQPWGLLQLGGAGGTGVIAITDGIVKASALTIVNGYIELSGGTLDVDSQWVDQSATVQGYLDAGLIRAAEGMELDIATYAGNGGTGTLITVVPEPMTMALLGLGGLFIRRKK